MAKNRKTENEMENAETPDINATENTADVGDVSENTPEEAAMTENPTENKDGEESKEVESDEGREQASADTAKNAQEEAGSARVDEGTQGQALESISDLSTKHRLPSWQTAAIMRMMDWEYDIMVSDADFRAAINKLHSRRIGGGRM